MMNRCQSSLESSTSITSSAKSTRPVRPRQSSRPTEKVCTLSSRSRTSSQKKSTKQEAKNPRRKQSGSLPLNSTRLSSLARNLAMNTSSETNLVQHSLNNGFAVLLSPKGLKNIPSELKSESSKILKKRITDRDDRPGLCVRQLRFIYRRHKG
jgi:hypothetical protein